METICLVPTESRPLVAIETHFWLLWKHVIWLLFKHIVWLLWKYIDRLEWRHIIW